MDQVHTDPLTNKKSVNYYVPIQQNDSVVAYLVGVIQCDTLDEKFIHKYIVERHKISLLIQRMDRL